MDDTLKTAESNNHLIPAIIGLRAQLNRGAVLLESKGSAKPLRLDNPLLLAALGILSSRQTLNRWLRDCENQTKNRQATAAADLKVLR
tara:strand:- start:15265 stop:15528 length:264 start_codon:yes stop_codon:yes gene_type:complete